MIKFIKANTGFLVQLGLIFSYILKNNIIYAFLISIFFLIIFFRTIKNTWVNKSQIDNLFLLIFLIGLGVSFNPTIDIKLFYHFIIVVSSYIGARLFVKSLDEYEKFSKYCLLLFQFSVVISALFRGFSNFPAVNPLEELIPGSSANVITTATIVLQINYVIAKYFSKNSIPLFTVFITLIISLIGYGRGSIISSFLILLVSVITKIKINNLKGLTVFLITGLLFIYLIFFKYFDDLIEFITLNTKISRGLVDYHREKIIGAYLNNLNFIKVITGSDYPDFVKYVYNGNPHNSFIRAHHLFGIFYFVFIFKIILESLFLLKRNKERILLLFLLIILFFKSFTETVLFPTIFDFYFFASFYFIPQLYSKNYNIKSTNFSLTH